MTDEAIISRIEAGEDGRTQFKREAIGCGLYWMMQ